MRVLHLALGGCLRAPPISYGITADTGGHVAYVLGASLAQARCADTDVTIVTRLFEDPRLGKAYTIPKERLAPTVKIVRLPSRRQGYVEKEAMGAELPSFKESFLEWLSRQPHLPHVIHAHFADAAEVGLAARERFGIPVVYTPHALGLDKLLRCGGEPGVREGSEAAAIAMADAIVVSSIDEKDHQISAYAVDGFEARTHVVSPGVPPPNDTIRTIGNPATFFAEPHRPLVLAVARPTFKKNLVGVVKAFIGSRLDATCNLIILAGQHDWGLQTAEEKAVLVELRSLLEAPIAERRAALPAYHRTADVWALYREAAASGGVFVSPALHEPFGLTLIEAAAARLPVVATKYGGAAEIVRTIGHGLLVEPQDRQAIAEACLRVIEKKKVQRKLVDACDRYADIYCWDRFARRSLEIYVATMTSAGGRVAVAA